MLYGMTATRKRNTDPETSRIEDGFAALASMLADMLTGAHKARSSGATRDSHDETEGAIPLENREAPVSEPPIQDEKTSS